MYNYLFRRALHKLLEITNEKQKMRWGVRASENELSFYFFSKQIKYFLFTNETIYTYIVK